MKRYFIGMVLTAFLLQGAAFSEENSTECNPCDYDCTFDCKTSKQWYGILGIGYAWSQKAGINNPDPAEWDASIQGYNANLGGAPFTKIGFGRKFLYYLRADATYTFFDTFHYFKFQTGVSDTVGFTGDNRTRHFDLDNQNLLFNLSFYPEKHFHLTGLSLDISPYIGGGIGVSFYRVSNFYTVAETDGVGSTTSIGDSVNNNAFAWQGLVGIRVHPVKSCISFDAGYHYFYGGTFKGPTMIYSNDSTFLGAATYAPAWKGKLKTHQLNLSFNYAF